MPPAPVEPGETSDAQDDAITRSFYAELRAAAGAMMRSERAGHTLQPTAVANEACLRILRRGWPDAPREHRLAIAARVLRQVLIDHARARGASKRRADGPGLDLSKTLGPAATHIDVDRVNSAIDRLRVLHERRAEVVTLRVFGGLTMEQIAAALGCSKRTVEGDWTVARAWLRRELAPAHPGATS